MEREERLLAMNDGNVNETLYDISREGGGKDARFLLAHGSDASYSVEDNIKGVPTGVLVHASEHGHLAVVEALLDAGAEDFGEALVWAAIRGQTVIVGVLLDHGADVHYGNDQAIYYAACHGKHEVAELLLDRGANPNTQMDWINGTPLKCARGEGHDDVAALLLSRGAVDDAA